MDSSRPELLMESIFESQDELFPSPEGFPGTDAMTFPLSEPHGFPPEKLYEEWQVNSRTGLTEREDPDDFLQMMINPNEVYSTEAAPSESPESDSGFSDDPRPETPTNCDSAAPIPEPAALYELIYDIGVMEERKARGEMSSVISIQLEDWHSPVLIPESCVVSELPTLHTGLCKATALPIRDSSQELLAIDALYPELHLTDEEKRLLSQEGVALPSNLPLTKAEERILKKVRRKIRNKQSAQDSRRRKKEYIDGLESRVAACSAQNQELHKKVMELEKHNISLITQLRKLQTLIKQTSNKAAQTGTCVLILIVSLALFIYPTYYPLRSGANLNEGAVYTPTGVISRNILNKEGFSEATEPPVPQDSPTPEPPLEDQAQEPANGDPELPEQQDREPERQGLGIPLERPEIQEGGSPDDQIFPRHKEIPVLDAGDSAGKDQSKTVRSDEI